MRLSSLQAETIKRAERDAFGDDPVVRLFGSRVHDDARGGDIDLHIEAPAAVADIDHEVRFRALLWKSLDEEQLDIVVAARGAAPRWIDDAARTEGVIL